jgi:predicted dehydrogenase
LPLTFAILGVGRIAPKALLAPSLGLCEVRGVASRSRERALEFAREHGLTRAYDSYRAALEDADVNAIYVPTPASTHAQWAQAALEAGKHVLCEKPFCLRGGEASALVHKAESAGLTLMEAHHSYFHPLRPAFVGEVARLGRVHAVSAVFDAPIRDEADIRLNPRLGAGVFLDFGGYLLSWLGWVAEARGAPGLEALKLQSARAEVRPVDIDRSMTAEVRLQLPEGTVLASLSCSMEPDVAFQARILVRGDSGEVVFENPLALEGSFLRTARGQRIEAPLGATTYRGQLEAFCREVEGGTRAPHTRLELVRLQELQAEVYAQAGLLSRYDLSLG